MGRKLAFCCFNKNFAPTSIRYNFYSIYSSCEMVDSGESPQWTMNKMQTYDWTILGNE